MADGSVIIKADVDDKQAQAELNRLTKKIDSLNEKISDKKQEQMPLVEQSKQLAAVLDDAKAKLDYMKSGDAFFTSSSIKEQEQTVASLQKEWDGVQKKVEAMDTSIAKDTRSLERMSTRAGELSAQLAGAKRHTQGMSPAAQEAAKQMEKFTNRIKGLARRVFVFTLITKALRALKDYMWSAIQTNEKAMKAVSKLKGALLVLAQPILNVLIPAFTVFVNVLTRIVNTISDLVSKIFGTTAEASAEAAENLYEESSAMDKTGKAAKKTSKSLASFDEINKLSGSNDKAKNGPDFTTGINDQLSAIMELFTGALLLAIGAILTFSGANIPVGITLMALGAAAIWGAVKTDWGAIAKLLQGPIGVVTAILSVALLAIGAIILFSGANIPLGLGLMVAGAIGLASVVAANWDTVKKMLQGPIGAVVGLLSGALLVLGAILAFSGASVPLGLGLMVAGAIGLATTVAANWDTIKTLLQGAIGGVVAVVSSALLVIGAVLVFSGVALPLGIGLLIAGAAGLAATVIANWDTITNLLGGPIGAITAMISGALLVLGVILVFTGVGIPLGLGMIVTGAAGLGSVVALNWDYLKEKLSETWESIKSWWQSSVAKYFTVEYWQDLGKNIIDGLLNGLKSAFESVKSWASNAMGSIKNAFTGGGNVRTPAINSASVPRLATGAVIPPNREFLAVLGDQKLGNNIEAPESAIEAAVARGMAQYGGGNQTAILKIGEQELGRIIFKLNKDQTQRVGIKVT